MLKMQRHRAHINDWLAIATSYLVLYKVGRAVEIAITLVVGNSCTKRLKPVMKAYAAVKALRKGVETVASIITKHICIVLYHIPTSKATPSTNVLPISEIPGDKNEYSASLTHKELDDLLRLESTQVYRVNQFERCPLSYRGPLG